MQALPLLGIQTTLDAFLNRFESLDLICQIRRWLHTQPHKALWVDAIKGSEQFLARTDCSISACSYSQSPGRSATPPCARVAEEPRHIFSSPWNRQGCLVSSPSSALSFIGCVIVSEWFIALGHSLLIPQIRLIILLLLLLLMQQEVLQFNKYFLMP